MKSDGVDIALNPSVLDFVEDIKTLEQACLAVARHLFVAWIEALDDALLAQKPKLFSVTIIVRVLLRVFDRITGLNPVQVESSSSSIRGGKGEALPGGQRAATLHQDKASIPNRTHYDRSMVRRFCQRVQS